MRLLLIRFLLPLALTLIIEVPVSALILRKKSAVLPLTVINILTNLALNLAIFAVDCTARPLLFRNIAITAGEISVWISEALLINATVDITRKKAFLLSLFLNLLSLLSGLIILH